MGATAEQKKQRESRNRAGWSFAGLLEFVVEALLFLPRLILAFLN